MSSQEEPGTREILDVEQIRVTADPETIVTMMSALIHIPSYRKNFEADPVGHLREVGIEVPPAVGDQITPESIRMTLDELTEGGEEPAVALAVIPGVAVAVRVGTRPGTSPGVRVGVSVATNTSTFARVEAVEGSTTVSVRQATTEPAPTTSTTGTTSASTTSTEDRGGLAPRQRGQQIKRGKRPRDYGKDDEG